jgi:hypothetical protein
MNSISTNFNYPKINDFPSNGNILYHYHKLEVITPQSSVSLDSKPLQRIDKIKKVTGNILILLGSLMTLLAAVAITLQTVGLTTPKITILANLLMPSLAAILTGSHLSRDQVKSPGTSFRIPTGVPGLTFSG